MRRVSGILTAVLMAISAPATLAAEQDYTTGDGTVFTLPIVDGLPGRAENDAAIFEFSGFDTDTSAAPSLTDRFAFVFKGGDQPQRVRVEDVTLPTPVLITEATVPDDLPGAGFRRSRFETRAAPCAIARGEPCSAWMFGDQPYRIYRATFIFADGETETLLQAEPYRMGAFIARLGTRIPDARSPPGPPERMRLRAIENLMRNIQSATRAATQMRRLPMQ